MERYRSWLDDGERARLEAMAHRASAELFVLARGLLRELVGDVVGVPPERTGVGYDARGRPHLLGSSAGTWSISIAHTPGLAAVALARTDVGIDVQARGERDHEAVARRVFTGPERAAMAAAGPPGTAAAQRYFYTVWTAKEAWMKACGLGFGAGPTRCEVAVGETGPRLMATGDTPPESWQLHGWWPSGSHAAALVARKALRR